MILKRNRASCIGHKEESELPGGELTGGLSFIEYHKMGLQREAKEHRSTYWPNLSVKIINGQKQVGHWALMVRYGPALLGFLENLLTLQSSNKQTNKKASKRCAGPAHFTPISSPWLC